MTPKVRAYWSNDTGALERNASICIAGRSMPARAESVFALDVDTRENARTLAGGIRGAAGGWCSFWADHCSSRRVGSNRDQSRMNMLERNGSSHRGRSVLVDAGPVSLAVNASVCARVLASALNKEAGSARAGRR